MPKKSYRQAISEALRQEMERDPRVILMGEDVAGGLGAPGEDDSWGGPLGVTKGLEPRFGRDRVLDTPITENNTWQDGEGIGQGGGVYIGTEVTSAQLAAGNLVYTHDGSETFTDSFKGSSGNRVGDLMTETAGDPHG